MDVLKRIIGSKKAALAFVTFLGNLGLAWGFDIPAEQLTEGIGLIWNSLGALLITSQGVLDLKWGSTSDGTGSDAE